MADTNIKNILSRYGTHWLLWAIAGLIFLVFYLGIWPFIYNVVILPNAVPEKHGLQVNVFDRLQTKGKPSQVFFNTSDKLTLEKSDTSLLAYGLWKVPQTGHFRVRLECDDFASLNLDGRDLIRLTGINAWNIGETEIELEAGFHLLVLRLYNRLGQGWLTLNTINSQQGYSLLRGTSLVYLDLADLNSWLQVVKVVKKGSEFLLILSLGALILLALVHLNKSSKKNQSQSSIAESINYLKSPKGQFGLAIALIFIFIYEILAKSNHPYPYSNWIVLLLIMTIIAAIFHSPRWIVYAFLLTMLTIHLLLFVKIISKGEQDPSSSRDEAVEVAAQTILHGENAWNRNVGAPITTGPTSILIALPFVLLFGEINWLSFLFWMVFYMVLLRGDLIYRNQSWPIMVMFLVLGYFGFEHTLYWSLDELYYPILYLVGAYFLINRNNFLSVGVLIAAAVLSRSNYIFMVVGFGFWYIFNSQVNRHNILKILLGCFLGGVVILLPFIIIGGKDLWVNNPWNLAFAISGTAWPDTNFIFKLLNHLNTQIGPGAMRWVKLGLTMSITFPLSWGLRLLRVQHPFWHITLGAFLANTIVWFPAHLPMDYALIFVLPAMLAISNTPTDSA